MLTLASFNLKDFFFSETEKKPLWFERRIEALRKPIAASNADLVAIQEVGSAKAAELLCEALGSSWSVALGFPDERGIRVGFLSRFPLHDVCIKECLNLPLPSLFGDGDALTGFPLKRPFLEVNIDVPFLGRVSCLSVHFKSNLPFYLEAQKQRTPFIPNSFERGSAVVRSTMLRSAEALFARRWFEEKKENHAVILGDFNDGPDSSVHQVLAGEGSLLFPALQKVPEKERYSMLYRGKKQLLDHILVSEDLAEHLAQAGIENKRLRDHGPFFQGKEPTIDSDHALVWARFHLESSI